jgi:hypothetical protein
MNVADTGIVVDREVTPANVPTAALVATAVLERDRVLVLLDTTTARASRASCAAASEAAFFDTPTPTPIAMINTIVPPNHKMSQ